ncbi:hypothetical protein Leryth_021363 [Lithospermum erythrorhizon]|nr:hypothetical protein Leryth_021363 [Lithospermum erythrorhizon]
MESASSWEYNSLINELTQGREQAMQLRAHLNSTPLTESQDLLQSILSSYEKSLSILKWSEPLVQPQPPALPISTVLESSLSVDGSSLSDDLSKSMQAHNECYSNASKKRKAMPTWTEQVRINPHTGLEGPGEDGYSWRKYGQKDILGAKYPRSYYRCTYRHTHNCWANKQVQRSDDDPSVFELTYKGTHTCNLASRSATLPPPSSEIQEMKHDYHHHSNNESLQPGQMIMHLRTNLRVETNDLETTEERSPFSAPPTFSSMTGETNECSLPVLPANDHRFPGTYTPSFISPGSSESNYFSTSSNQMYDFKKIHDLKHSELEQNGMFSTNASSTNSPITNGMFSTNASSTNSPITGLEFFMDPVDLDSNFPFDTTGFFS